MDNYEINSFKHYEQRIFQYQNSEEFIISQLNPKHNYWRKQKDEVVVYFPSAFLLRFFIFKVSLKEMKKQHLKLVDKIINSKP